MFKKILLTILMFICSFNFVFAETAQLKDYIDPLNLSEATNSGYGNGISNTLSYTVGKVLDQVFGILGIIALCIVIYSGIMYIASLGKNEKAKKALNYMIWAAIGLIVIFLSYAMVKFVLQQIVKVGQSV